jgi:hypothetical protein
MTPPNLEDGTVRLGTTSIRLLRATMILYPFQPKKRARADTDNYRGTTVRFSSWVRTVSVHSELFTAARRNVIGMSLSIWCVRGMS